MRSSRLVLWLAALTLGCASYTLLSEEQRGRLENEYGRAHSAQFLKVSMDVTPFFGDQSARLLTDLPPDEVRLLDDSEGHPIDPGKVERILPAGTQVEIDRLEFPTSLAVGGRMLYTPRTRPWLYLHLRGQPNGPPLILVLRAEMRTESEVQSEIARYLTEADPAAQLARFPRPVQDAIAQKRALIDMPAEALLMAWGYPEKIHREFPEAGRKETWTWPDGLRKAELLDGRVSDLAGE
jgi:hypothetical protein